MARNRVIGRNGGLPWHVPEDLKRFKALTMGKPLVMGRKTWESLPGLLPGRPHVVVTRRQDYAAEGIHVVATLEAALQKADALAAASDADEIMVIGGAEIYRAALPHAQRIYLTEIDAEVEGDTWFPELGCEWKILSDEGWAQPSNEAFAYRFLVLQLGA